MLDGQHFQQAYITHDIERTIAEFEARYGMAFHCRETGANVWTPGGPERVAAKVALGWHRNLQYELIQPISGHVDFYREVLTDDDVPRFHHMGFRVADWDETLAAIEVEGLPIVLTGDAGEVKFVYVDAREKVGHYLEYIWFTEARWAGMRQAPGDAFI